MNYTAWQVNMGDNITGMSAYCMRQLGQLRELDIRHGICDNPNANVYNDWRLERWHGGGVYWHEGDNLPYNNSWEYYFENGTYEDNHIQSSGGYDVKYVPTPGTKNFRDKQELAIFSKLVKKYFIPKSNIINSLNDDVIKYKTLGVHCRRSTMGMSHPNAYLGYTDEQYYKKVMEVVFKYGFEKIYLATEEISIYEYFKQRVPDLLLGIDNCYRVQPHIILETTFKNNIRPLHAYTSGLEVLCDTIDLSRCHSLLCYVSGVTSMACFFNGGKYDNVYYFDEL